jgi:hypothetical protein
MPRGYWAYNPIPAKLTKYEKEEITLSAYSGQLSGRIHL